MDLFLDSSTVLAACGRKTGASRLIFEIADSHGWVLQTSSYVTNEVEANLPRLPGALVEWRSLRSRLRSVPDILSFPWIATFSPTKDRPILFTAAAWSDILLTLDRRDFTKLLGTRFYGLSIFKPGDFLKRERAAGRWA